MTKYEYLAELERLLSALPEQERRDAMNYYEEYFVSAGPEKEAEAIHELGTPQQVARKILEEAGVNPGDQATGNPIYAAAQPSGRRKLSTPMIVLLVVVAVLVVVPIIAGLLGGLAFGSFTAQTTAAVESEPVAGSSGGSAESLPQPTAGSGTAETASNGTVSLGADLRKLEIDIYNVDLTVEVDPGVAGPVVSAPELPQDQVVVRRESDGEVKLYLGNRDDLRNQGTLIPVPATLTLPADVSTKDMDFELYAGSVSIPDLTLQELDISVNAGEVTLGAMRARWLQPPSRRMRWTLEPTQAPSKWNRSRPILPGWKPTPVESRLTGSKPAVKGNLMFVPAPCRWDWLVRKPSII